MQAEIQATTRAVAKRRFSAPHPLMTPLQIARAALPAYGIHDPVTAAEFVAGGLTHRLLRVETGAQKWALKLLSPRAVATSDGRQRLERAEELAHLAARNGIPALVALSGANGSKLQRVENNWLILYAWIDGQTLPPTAAIPARCAQIGALLGKLHALKVRFPGQSEPTPEAFERGHFAAILERARETNAPFASPLEADLDEVEAANALAMRAQLELRQNWVTGHLDFDQKNVLWSGENSEEPTILDWENAKPIHPALEAMGAALSWAGQSAGAPDSDSFAAFLRAYQAENAVTPAELNTAVDGVLGKWIIWLEFNLQRLLEPQIAGTPEAQIALDAGLHALGATLQLRADGTKYREWITRV